MKDHNNDDLQELKEDFETYLWKILKYFYTIAVISLPLVVIVYLFYLYGDPVENYTSEEGMLAIISICISVILLKVILKKIWFNKPWHD